MTDDGLGAHTGERRATKVAAVIYALNRMLEFGHLSYVPIPGPQVEVRSVYLHRVGPRAKCTCADQLENWLIFVVSIRSAGRRILPASELLSDLDNEPQYARAGRSAETRRRYVR